MNSSVLIVGLLALNHGLSQDVGKTATEYSPWSVKQLVEQHLQWKKQLRAEDVYKLFYQASFGVEHLLADTAAVRLSLQEEINALDTNSLHEPLLERISLAGEMVRLNLRPCKALNLSQEMLVEVMFRSAQETIPDTLMFFRMWNEFASLVKYGLLAFPADEVAALEKRVATGELKAAHHSRQYTDANKPAYRVVRREVFEEMMRGRERTEKLKP